MSGQPANDDSPEVYSIFHPYSHGLWTLVAITVVSFAATGVTMLARGRVTYHDLIVWAVVSFICCLLLSESPRLRTRAVLESLFGAVVSVLCAFIFATQYYDQVIFP